VQNGRLLEVIINANNMRGYSGFYKDNIIDFPHSTEYVELRNTDS